MILLGSVATQFYLRYPTQFSFIGPFYFSCLLCSFSVEFNAERQSEIIVKAESCRNRNHTLTMEA